MAGKVQPLYDHGRGRRRPEREKEILFVHFCLPPLSFHPLFLYRTEYSEWTARLLLVCTLYDVAFCKIYKDPGAPMSKLRILMYHGVSDKGLRDGLTVDSV